MKMNQMEVRLILRSQIQMRRELNVINYHLSVCTIKSNFSRRSQLAKKEKLTCNKMMMLNMIIKMKMTTMITTIVKK